MKYIIWFILSGCAVGYGMDVDSNTLKFGGGVSLMLAFATTLLAYLDGKFSNYS